MWCHREGQQILCAPRLQYNEKVRKKKKNEPWEQKKTRHKKQGKGPKELIGTYYNTLNKPFILPPKIRTQDHISKSDIQRSQRKF